MVVMSAWAVYLAPEEAKIGQAIWSTIVFVGVLMLSVFFGMVLGTLKYKYLVRCKDRKSRQNA